MVNDTETIEADARALYREIRIPVTWEEVTEILKTEMDAKALSWNILAKAEKTNSFALRIFENALDYSVGLTIIGFRKALRAIKKKAPKFFVSISKNGDVGIALTECGKVVFQ